MNLKVKESLAAESIDSSLINVISAIADACSKISFILQTSELHSLQGSLESDNIQGEVQKELDIIAHDVFVEALEKTGQVAAMVSEEVEEIIYPKNKGDQFLVAFDPLDGSSNIELNMSVGSIFSIRPAGGATVGDVEKAFLQKGHEQIAAGYAIYGPSTMLVFAINGKNHAFARDPKDGCFHQVEAHLTIPKKSKEFSINMSRYHLWDAPIRNYIDSCITANSSRCNMRWIASMVAEVHRVVTRGGIFLYPIDNENRPQGGRLRWLYEACPMALVIEAAGGMASTGFAPILDVCGENIHQRVPVILGAADDVMKIAKAYKTYV